jgi:hypothetical protein
MVEAGQGRQAVKLKREGEPSFEFDNWWSVNHPFDWWASERDGEPLPHADRLRVALMARAAWEAAKRKAKA